MRRFVIVAALGALLSTTATITHAATQTLAPVADAFVAASEPNNNFGAAGGIEVSAPGSPTGEFQAVMRFDPAPARAAFDAEFGTGNWSLTSVALRLGTTNPNNPFFNPNVAGPFTVTWM